MNLGFGELLVVLFNLGIVILFLALPVIVVLFLIRLLRRMRTLEERVDQLEGRQDSASDMPPQAS